MCDFLVTQKQSKRRIFLRAGAEAGLGPRGMRMRLLRLLMPPRAPSLTFGIAVASTLLVGETAAVCLLNLVTGTTGNFGTLYLIGVVAVSMTWGFGLSAAMSVASAVAFAYLRHWPNLDTAPFEPLNGVVLAVFLLVAALQPATFRIAQYDIQVGNTKGGAR